MFLSIGYLFGQWLIGKAEYYVWAPSLFTKETSPSSNQEEDILKDQQEDELPESSEDDDVEEDESEDDRIYMTTLARAYTRVQAPSNTQSGRGISRIYTI